ncbi:MAG: rhamnan synthesis F family protein [Dokdonella sp.]|uniref:rhamnan synthesis F family protein n=1 Tax=Dokdonella sp. TaxID=2291710 RepID=UPI0032657DCF
MRETHAREWSRIALYLFYDEAGIVDPYVITALQAFREHVDRLVIVCNGPPLPDGLVALKSVSDDVLVRVNTGFDVGGYQEGLEILGRAAVESYDELLLLNYTFFAPIFPLAEMFEAMESRACDFWGISAHKELRPNPLTGGDVLPFHIQSHFIAVRKPLLDSDAFWSYWSQMPPIRSYVDSITHHESRFTQHFGSLGHAFSVYMDLEDFHTAHPMLMEVDRMIEMRCPIIKRRAFFHDPIYMESEAIDLRRALDLIRTTSSYDIGLIHQNLLRTVNLRTVYTNLELLDVFTDARDPGMRTSWTFGAVAVVAHVYYVDLLEELLDYAGHIPCPFDLYVTTDSADKQHAIMQRLASFDRGSTRVDVVASNVGRDTAALLIEQRDVVLSGHYGLLCRLHTKKSPQDGAVRAASFKRHLLENLLASPGFVSSVFDVFEDDPRVGMVLPPVVHIGYPTLGHAWFLNQPRVTAIAKRLGIALQPDVHTPLAAYGSMFWFRPQALAPLFAHPWTWNEFDETVYGDMDLPHAIERLLTYCAQSEGYSTRCVFTARQAARNYAKLEYKMQLLSSCFRTGDIRSQVLQMIYGTEAEERAKAADTGVRVSFQRLVTALRNSLRFRIAQASRRVPTRLSAARREPAKQPVLRRE